MDVVLEYKLLSLEFKGMLFPIDLSSLSILELYFSFNEDLHLLYMIIS